MKIEGCAMGASTSSVIAQLVLEDLEETIISKLDFYLLFICRYVDDCIIIIPQDKKGYMLTMFNNSHTKIQFTIETETNNKINFLDVTLHKTNNIIKTQW